jgi:hypothetical protein
MPHKHVHSHGSGTVLLCSFQYHWIIVCSVTAWSSPHHMLLGSTCACFSLALWSYVICFASAGLARTALGTDGCAKASALACVTVFLSPLSPCDLVCAESKLAACATPFCPSLLATNTTVPNGHLTYTVPITSDIVWRSCFPSSTFCLLKIIAQHVSHACCINGSFPWNKWVAIQWA